MGRTGIWLSGFLRSALAMWLSCLLVWWQRASSELPSILYSHFTGTRQNSSPKQRDHPSHKTHTSTAVELKRDLETEHLEGWPGDTARPPGLHSLVHCQPQPGRPPAWPQWSFSHDFVQHNSLKHNFLMSPGNAITAPCL